MPRKCICTYTKEVKIKRFVKGNFKTPMLHWKTNQNPPTEYGRERLAGMFCNNREETSPPNSQHVQPHKCYSHCKEGSRQTFPLAKRFLCECPVMEIKLEKWGPTNCYCKM